MEPNDLVCCDRQASNAPSFPSETSLTWTLIAMLPSLIWSPEAPIESLSTIDSILAFGGTLDQTFQTPPIIQTQSFLLIMRYSQSKSPTSDCQSHMSLVFWNTEIVSKEKNYSHFLSLHLMVGSCCLGPVVRQHMNQESSA